MSDRALDIYLREIMKFPPLIREEETELAEESKRGNLVARERIILRHLQSVVKIAKLYQRVGISLGDLIDEGNTGLLKALSRFDPSKGVRFISYASWWVRHYIHRLIYQQTKIVKVPVSKIVGRKAIREMEDVLSQKFGRIPSTEEIAKALNITPHEVSQAMELAQNDFSLDLQVGKEEGSSLLDFIRASPERLEDSVVRELLAGELEERMKELSSEEQLVICLRFGLSGEKTHKLREIGELLNLSRERVRQMEERALGKLRKKIR